MFFMIFVSAQKCSLIDSCLLVQAMSTPDAGSGGEHESRVGGGGGDGSKCDGERDSVPSSPMPSPRTHNRSVSHDSYFNLLDRDERITPREGAVAEEGESDLELSPESSKLFLDISELHMDFNTSEPEMKIFSEDETLRSTSIEESLSRSTLDMENLSMGSGSAKSKENINFRSEKRSLRDKLKHKFSSPSLPRKDVAVNLVEKTDNSHNFSRTSVTLRDNIFLTSSPEMCKRRSDSALSGEASSPTLAAADQVRSNTSTAPKVPPKPVSPTKDQTSPQDKDLSFIEDDTSRVSEDTRSEHSFESALIDPELMAKITKLRSSPSVTASEASSTSLAEATVSDNESFTLGSSGSNGATANIGAKSSNVNDCEDHGTGDAVRPVSGWQASQDLIPTTPLISIMTESCPGNLDINTSENKECDSISIGESKSESTETARPTCLIGMNLEGSLLSVGTSGTSPDTPQGDSTFMDIQYHPLSDTTEPSTPSESPFTDQNADPTTPVARPAGVFPTRGARLSPDLSSSSADDPIDNVPIYENMNSSSTSIKATELLGSESPSMEFDVNYENVGFNSESFGSAQDLSSSQKIQITNTIIRKKSLPKKLKKNEEISDSNTEQSLTTDNTYENVKQVNLSSPKIGLLETALDDDYEEYQFKNMPYLNNVLNDSDLSEIPDISSDCDLTAAEINGEIVYQQVKYLRRSIQEINDLIIDDKLEHDTPCTNNKGSSEDVPQVNEQPCDTEHVESPVTPTSPSLVTEVLVLPSFASPTESTTDDITSSEASEALSSTASLHPCSRASPSVMSAANVQLADIYPLDNPISPLSLMAATVSPLADILSADKPPQSPAHSSGRLSASFVSPTPRPRSSVGTSSKPRVLPKLNLSSDSSSPSPSCSQPLSPLSGTTTPRSGAATPSLPSSESGTPTEDVKNLCKEDINSPISSQPKNITYDTSFKNDTGVESTTQDIQSLEFKEPWQNTNNISAVALMSKFSEEVESNIPKHPLNGQPLQRHKTSPDIMKPQILHDNASPHSKEAEDLPAKAKSDPGCSDIAIALTDDDTNKRERIERYKEERRMFLREKYKSESFRGEKDEMLLRLKQKATSPSRTEDENIESSLEDAKDSMNESSRISYKLDVKISPKHDECSSIPRISSPKSGSIATNFLFDSPGESQTSSEFKSTDDSNVGHIPESNSLGSIGSARIHQEANFVAFRKPTTLPKILRSDDSRPAIGLQRSSFETTGNASPIGNISSSVDCDKESSNHQSFQRSSSTRSSSGHKISPLKANPEEDINVKEIIAVWGKDSKPEVRTPTSPLEKPSRKKFETGLYYGGNKSSVPSLPAKPEAPVIGRRFDRGISHDPNQIRPIAEPVGSSRLNRGISCEDSANSLKPRANRSSGKESPSKRANGKFSNEQSSSVSKKMHLDNKLDAHVVENSAENFGLRSLKKSASSTMSSAPLQSLSSTSALSCSEATKVSASFSKPSSVSQQRRIKDMAAMFEGPHSCSATAQIAPPTAVHPKVLRQTSRENK